MDQGAQDYLRYLQGDDDGLVSIIEAYKDRLILYLFSFVKDIYIAEDLAEDVFFKLALRKAPFRGKSTFQTYLFAIARNQAIDYLRRAKRIKALSERIQVEIKHEENPEELFLREENVRVLHRAMEKLSTDYRDVLFLSYFQSLAVDEICRVMKKTKKQTENLLYRAKLALKKELNEEGYDREDFT